MKKKSMSDRTFDIVNKTFILLLTIIIIYPLIYIMSASISDPTAVNTGQVWLFPVDVTLDGFKEVFKNESIWTGYKNTIFYTVAGTILHLSLLLPCAYALSRKHLKGKKAFTWFILFTMFFNGGMIPTYLVVKELGILNTPFAMIVPGALGAWAIFVTRSTLEQSIPESLVEAAKIDGATDFQIFFKIVLPLSIPIIGVMALFHGVGIWNQYFNGLIYLSDVELFPLQLILREILIINDASTNSGIAGGSTGSLVDQVRMASQIKYAVMIVSSLPLLIAYPFLQKYFVKGVLVGSVKE